MRSLNMTSRTKRAYLPKKRVKVNSKENYWTKWLFNRIRYFFIAKSWAKRLQLILKISLFLAFIVLYFFGSFTRAWNKTEVFLENYTTDLGFNVQNVLVVGRKLISADDILKKLEVEKGRNILNFDIKAAQRRLSSVAWIKSVIIEKHFPNSLYIKIIERTPIAMWKNDNKIKLVDGDGVVAGIDSDILLQYNNLPLLFGDAAPIHAFDLAKLYKQTPNLTSMVNAATFISKRRWNIKLNNGTEIRLPAQGFNEAWLELNKIEQERHILSDNIAIIDLRQRDRLIIRFKNEEPAALSFTQTSGE